MKRVLNITLCLLFFSAVKANEDSLIVFSLLQQAKQTENVDSSITYANKAMSYAKKHNYLDGVLDVAKHFGNQYAQTGELEKSVQLYQQVVAENKFDKKQLSTAYNQLGIYHVYMGHYDSTEVYFLKALALRKQLKDTVGVGASLNNLGNVVMNTGAYDKAVNYFINALKIREGINDSTGIASTTNNLGMIYYKQQNFSVAINYYQKALAINQKSKVIDKEILILNNLGNIYDEMKKLDSSVFYYEQAITAAEDFGDLRILAMSYGNMAVTQHKKKNYDLSKTYINKALAIRVPSNDLEGQAILYNNLAAVYVSTNQQDSAIYYFKKSLIFSVQIDYKECTRDNYLGLSDAYEKSNQFEKAFEMHQKYSLIKDSILNEITTKQIAEMQTKYNASKKEKEIVEQKVKLSDQELKVKQRNYLLLGVGGLAFFILVIGFFSYRQQKAKQHKLLEENRLKDKIAVVALQNKLHEERLKISGDLHDNIGSQLSYIISSIDNMKHFFNTVDEKLSDKLTDIANFTRTTITQLRDTIWALNKDEISFDDLKSRLYNYIETAKLAQEQTEFVFTSNMDSSFQLNSIEGVSIYRIVQEAINNTMKYAAATKVELLISETNKFISIEIKDDGIGFKMSEILLGNGLENMKNRAVSIHAEFIINSAPEEGTSIKLMLNKDRLYAV